MAIACLSAARTPTTCTFTPKTASLALAAGITGAAIHGTTGARALPISSRTRRTYATSAGIAHGASLPHATHGTAHAAAPSGTTHHTAHAAALSSTGHHAAHVADATWPGHHPAHTATLTTHHATHAAGAARPGHPAHAATTTLAAHRAGQAASLPRSTLRAAHGAPFLG